MTTNSKLSRSKEVATVDPEAITVRATRMVVAIGRHFGFDTARIRNEARAAIKTALEGGDPMVKEIEVNGKPEACDSLDAVFRITLDAHGIDRHQRSQERGFAAVCRTLDELLDPS